MPSTTSGGLPYAPRRACPCSMQTHHGLHVMDALASFLLGLICPAWPCTLPGPGRHLCLCLCPYAPSTCPELHLGAVWQSLRFNPVCMHIANRFACIYKNLNASTHVPYRTRQGSPRQLGRGPGGWRCVLRLGGGRGAPGRRCSGCRCGSDAGGGGAARSSSSSHGCSCRCGRCCGHDGARGGGSGGRRSCGR